MRMWFYYSNVQITAAYLSHAVLVRVPLGDLECMSLTCAA